MKRYLGNLHTVEVHDTHNENPNCQLDKINVEHRGWYDSLAAAKASHPFDYCYWCLGGHR